MNLCPVCEGVVTSSVVDDRFEVNGVKLTASFPVYYCERCDMSFRDHESEDARDSARKQYASVLDEGSGTALHWID